MKKQGADCDIKAIIGNLIFHFTVPAALALCFYKTVKAITGYLIITFMAVIRISYYLAYSAVSLGMEVNNVWINVWSQCAKKGYVVDNRAMDIILGTTQIILLIVFLVLFSVLCCCSLKKIVLSLRDKEYAGAAYRNGAYPFRHTEYEARYEEHANRYHAACLKKRQCREYGTTCLFALVCPELGYRE